jgi:hypothetical protein
MVLFFLEHISVNAYRGNNLRVVEERNYYTNNVLFILCIFKYMGQNNTA